MNRFVVLALALPLVREPSPDPCGERSNDTRQRVTISVMSFNIRYDNPDDGIHAWTNRRTDVLAFLNERAPDLLCIQEALHSQILDLDGGLNGFSYRGVGRDDGARKGEYCAVFFNSRRFTCENDTTVWLSPTPRVPSVGWDAALPRILTMVQLEDRTSHRRFLVLNTHFDHEGADARNRSAAFLRSFVERHSAGLPVIVAGDFNCLETDEPYRILTRPDGPSGVLNDAMRISATGHAGAHGTFSGFPLTKKMLGPRIDYIFVTEGISVECHETLRPSRADGFLSDHLPVIAELTLPSAHESYTRP
jgi:endonuclease/exonuclease/phosphatase family metal-dependent hydrolase